MTYEQQVTFTALPNGYDATTNKLRLSVHVAPRLEASPLPPPGSPPIDLNNNWPDWVNWPGATITFGLTLNGPGSPVTVPASAVSIVSPARQSNLWKALFPPATTPVTPFAFQNFTNKNVYTVPAATIRSHLMSQYGSLSRNFPGAAPDAATLLDSKLGLGGIIDGLVTVTPNQNDTGTSVYVQTGLPNEIEMPDGVSDSANLSIPPTLNGTYDDAGLVQALKDYDAAVQATHATKPPSSPAHAFVQTQRFHQSFLPAYRKSDGTPYATTAVPSFDFHQMLATANEHPMLLRLLGLVFDLEFALPSTVTSLSSIQVVPNWTPMLAGPSNTVIVQPVTQCFYGSNKFGAHQFIAAPRDVTQQADGALPLDDPSQYDVVEIDHDGAALKTFDFANHVLIATQVAATITTPANYVPPALRSPGLKVAHYDRASQLYTQWSNQQTINGGGTAPSVYAEDLTRGYVVHVFDTLTKRWHSLTQRSGTYSFPTIGQTLSVTDEAAMSAATTSDPTMPDGSGTEHRLSPNLFHWTGWSLAAQHPGNQLQKDGTSNTNSNTPLHNGFPFAAQFQAKPGSLPRLRYGQSYRFRARPVDLAGNSLPFGDPTVEADPHALPNPTTSPPQPAFPYTRFEPVNQPAVLMRQPRTEGESLERLVIRSNYNTPATADDERHITPPKTSELMAEFHGLFDNGTTLDPGAYSTIGGLVDGNWATSGQGTPDPGDPLSNYQPASFYFGANSLTLPYMPDPLARGAAFLGLPGQPAGASGIFTAPFTPVTNKAWPYIMPFRFSLIEGSSAPAWTTGGANLLTVSIPKAVVAEVQLSCYVNNADLPLLGQFQWAASGLSGSALSNLQAQATTGQLWAITPFRTLTLVHAVQQPLLTPEFSQSFVASKFFIGQTFALLDDLMSFSRKSTSKVHIFANWNEAIDLGPGSAPPALVPAGTVALDVELNKAVPPDVNPPTAPPDDEIVLIQRHEFGDTKFRQVTYQAEATTAFAEYFYQTQDVQLPNATPVSLAPLGFIPGTLTVSSLPGATLTNADLTGISFADDAHGWAVFKNGLLVTSNGGQTWHSLSLPTTQILTDVAAVAVPGAGSPPGPATYTVCVVGQAGTILRSTDGGASWTAPVSGTTQNLNGAVFADTSRAWAVGQAGTILTTLDGGMTWSPQTSPSTQNLNAVSVITVPGSTPHKYMGWAVGQAGTLLTTDGSTWSPLSLSANSVSLTSQNLGGVSFVAVPGTGSPPGPTTYSGILLGPSGAIYSSADGGHTWLALLSPTTQNLLAVDILAPNGAGWLAGQKGLLYESLTGGLKWTPQASRYVPALPTDPTTGLPGPVQKPVTDVTTATNGTFGSVGPFYYVVTALTPAGESVASAELQVKLASATDNALISWVAQPGATNGFKVYRGTVSGGESILVGRAGPGSTSLTDTGAVGTLAFPPDYAESDVAGTVAWSPGSAIPTTAKVAIRYLPAPITRTGAARVMNVLNSKRPAAPKVAYVLPTFAWQRSTNASGIHSTRKGSTLRVYLERPWWDSGAGELLGVVTWHGPTGNTNTSQIDPTTGVPSLLEKYISRVGNDPVHQSPATEFTTEMDDFPLAVATRAQTSLVELSTAQRFNATNAVDVAGHTVTYDPNTDMWFADIEIDVGDVYWPYVRLALARFQPNSLTTAGTYVVDVTSTDPSIPHPVATGGPNIPAIDDDTDLSPVVLADFIQVAPDRSVTVTRGAANPNMIGVAMTGRSYSAVDSGSTVTSGTAGTGVGATPMSGPSVVTVTLEKRSATVGSDLGWDQVYDAKTPSNPVVVYMDNQSSGNGITTWTTSLMLPGSGGPFRLVIEEFELYPNDETAATISSGRPVYGNRVVHTDIIQLGGDSSPPPPPNPTRVDAAGQHGAIATSTNQGLNWSALNPGTTQDLNDVSVVGTAFAAAVGQGGTIVATTNGGTNWTVQTSGTTQNLRGVSFIDVSHGWAVGQKGTILVTSNGGSTWSKQTAPGTQDLNAVCFVDASHGWAVGQGGTVLFTSTGGTTWSAASPTPTGKNLFGVCFVDPLRGWIVGQAGTVLITTNGGTSWSTPAPAPTTQDLRGVSFVDANDGWVVGNGGTILTTGTGGTTWKAQTSHTNQTLNGVEFIDLNHGVVVGQSQTILVTSTGGSSWAPASSPTNVNWLGVD